MAGSSASTPTTCTSSCTSTPAARTPRGSATAAGCPAAARLYALNPGDVVLVDEAGMAGTFALDQLVVIASQRGALVRLIGDDRQLSAVESGGALRLIAHESGAAELTALYRFTDPAEAAATLKLRIGDASALDYYLQPRPGPVRLPGRR